MPDEFQVAYERAKRRIGEIAWSTMVPANRTDAIYTELRSLDLEILAERSAWKIGAANQPPT